MANGYIAIPSLVKYIYKSVLILLIGIAQSYYENNLVLGFLAQERLHKSSIVAIFAAIPD
jgi:hypothetical protein